MIREADGIEILVAAFGAQDNWEDFLDFRLAECAARLELDVEIEPRGDGVVVVVVKHMQLFCFFVGGEDADLRFAERGF